MKDALWLAAILFLVAPGMVICYLPIVSRMPRLSQLALAFPTGVLIVTLLAYVYALREIEWSRANLSIPLIALAILGWRVRGERQTANGDRLSTILIVVSLAIAVYAAADARETCGDLIYIWGPKARAFFDARGIDPEFLGRMFYDFMHPDYPPLVPLTYAWASIVAHQFSWWMPLLLTPLVIFCMAYTFLGFGGSPRRTALLTAVVTYAFASAYVAGAADPFLQLFESIAVMALTFAPESRDARWIAAGALAAAALTKVEGTAFAITVAIAYVMVHRRVWRAAAMLAPALILLGTWLLYAWRWDLLDQYARVHSKAYWNLLPSVIGKVADRASYRSAWLPWIAAAAPLFWGVSWRRIAFPLLVAAGSLATTLFFYLHYPDPSWWIAASADRVLLTPLICVAIACSAP